MGSRVSTTWDKVLKLFGADWGVPLGKSCSGSVSKSNLFFHIQHMQLLNMCNVPSTFAYIHSYMHHTTIHTGTDISICCDQFEPEMFVNLLIMEPKKDKNFMLRFLEDDNFCILEISPDYKQKVSNIFNTQ